MLRKKNIQDVYDILENSKFTAIAFNVNEKPDKGLIEIDLKDSSFWFRISDTGGSVLSSIMNKQAFSEPDVFYTVLVPGKNKNQEEYKHDSFQSCLSELSNWIEYVHEELLSMSPVFNYVYKARQELEDLIKSNLSDPDEYFTKAEAEDLENKIKDLIKRVEQLEIEKDQIEKFKFEVNSMVNDLKVHKKGFWFKVTGSKLLRFFEKISQDPEIQEIASEGIKNLLE